MARTWATEEEVENAFTAYLSGVLPGEVRVVAAGSVAQNTYPCVEVFITGNDNINESAGWNDHRAMEGQITVGTEAKDEKQDGQTLKTLREIHAELKDATILALSPANLATLLNATGHARISLVTFGKIERQIVNNVMETRIPFGALV